MQACGDERRKRLKRTRTSRHLQRKARARQRLTGERYTTALAAVKAGDALPRGVLDKYPVVTTSEGAGRMLPEGVQGDLLMVLEGAGGDAYPSPLQGCSMSGVVTSMQIDGSEIQAVADLDVTQPASFLTSEVEKAQARAPGRYVIPAEGDPIREGDTVQNIQRPEQQLWVAAVDGRYLYLGTNLQISTTIEEWRTVARSTNDEYLLALAQSSKGPGFSRRREITQGKLNAMGVEVFAGVICSIEFLKIMRDLDDDVLAASIATEQLKVGGNVDLVFVGQAEQQRRAELLRLLERTQSDLLEGGAS